MLSTAKSTPPRKRTTPNARYHRKNETLRSGANPRRRPAAQISAALAGETITISPNAIATAPNNKFIAMVLLLRTRSFGDFAKSGSTVAQCGFESMNVTHRSQHLDGPAGRTFQLLTSERPG